MFEALKQPLYEDIALVKEQEKPQLDFFVEAASTGLAERGEDAAEKAGEGKRPVYSVGLTLNMDLGDTRVSAKRAEVAAGVAELDAQKVEADRNLRREINLAYLALSHSYRKRAQASRSVESLRKKWIEELKKVRQARSEEIAALVFEIEMLSAQAAEIVSKYNARIAEARIRHSLHAYPTE